MFVFRQQQKTIVLLTQTKVKHYISVINSFLSKYFSTIDFRSIVNCKKFLKSNLNEFLKIEYFLNN